MRLRRTAASARPGGGPARGSSGGVGRDALRISSGYGTSNCPYATGIGGTGGIPAGAAAGGEAHGGEVG